MELVTGYLSGTKCRPGEDPSRGVTGVLSHSRESRTVGGWGEESTTFRLGGEGSGCKVRPANALFGGLELYFWVAQLQAGALCTPGVLTTSQLWYVVYCTCVGRENAYVDGPWCAGRCVCVHVLFYVLCAGYVQCSLFLCCLYVGVCVCVCVCVCLRVCVQVCANRQKNGGSFVAFFWRSMGA
ncbi:hypothetical protein B0H63DRAFT_742 [Podospora didyma]|uniref:Uncharacterized protein n=1 Tax=Podospora didyma TaxID=330526 RepID=A0AAE0P3W6_9PEZI|nr:hypothetical protein B0H63DRAFT_742 [Podospora didyma]